MVVGLGVQALGVAGGDEVEVGGVVVGGGGSGGAGGDAGLVGFAGGEVVDGEQVRDVDDHGGVLVVEGGVGEPGVAAGALPVERLPGDQVEGGPQVGDAVGPAGGPAQPQPAEQVGVDEHAVDAVDAAAAVGAGGGGRQERRAGVGVAAEPGAGDGDGLTQPGGAGDAGGAGPQVLGELVGADPAGSGGEVGDDLGVPRQPRPAGGQRSGGVDGDGAEQADLGDAAVGVVPGGQVGVQGGVGVGGVPGEVGGDDGGQRGDVLGRGRGLGEVDGGRLGKHRGRRFLLRPRQVRDVEGPGRAVRGRDGPLGAQVALGVGELLPGGGSPARRDRDVVGPLDGGEQAGQVAGGLVGQPVREDVDAEPRDPGPPVGADVEDPPGRVVRCPACGGQDDGHPAAGPGGGRGAQVGGVALGQGVGGGQDDLGEPQVSGDVEQPPGEHVEAGLVQGLRCCRPGGGGPRRGPW